MQMRKLAKVRIPKNPSEKEFCKVIAKCGWKFTKRGWPDFFCWKKNKIMCVEVKPMGSFLKPSQLLLMKRLAKLEVPCYVYTAGFGIRKLSKS